MVQAARALLSAVTRVLILADTVVVKQIIVVKKNVTIEKILSSKRKICPIHFQRLIPR